MFSWGQQTPIFFPLVARHLPFSVMLTSSTLDLVFA